MTFKALVGQLIGLINIIIPVLAAAALALFFVGVVRFIYNTSEHGRIGDKQLIVWGLVAIFVLFSLWGIVRLLTRSFLG